MVSVITGVTGGVLINWLTNIVPGVAKVAGSSGRPGDTLVGAGRGEDPNDAMGLTGDNGGWPELRIG